MKRYLPYIATGILIGLAAYLATKKELRLNTLCHKEGTSMSNVCKHSIMTKLIDDLELKVLKSPSNAVNVTVNGEDLLILVEYARQLEAVIKMMDDDPSKARQLFKH
jgi:hypothetical protein